MRCRRTLSPDPDPDTKPNPSLKPNPEPDPNPDPNHNPDPKGMLPLHRVCREDASSAPPQPQQQPEQPTLALPPQDGAAALPEEMLTASVGRGVAIIKLLRFMLD